MQKQARNVGGQELHFSICVFKLETLPNFIDEEISIKWREQKLAYLLIVDFKDYVFITRKNISGIDKLLYEGITLIDYAILNTLFVDSGTFFEKFSLNNTSVAQDSIRGKTIEAIDLKKSFSPYGAGKYVLSSVRVSNYEEKTSIAFNTSRITKFGEKKYLDALLVWAHEVIEKIRNHIHGNSFLDVFATPIEYEAHRDTLIPISFLFNLRKFHEDVETGRLLNCELRLSGVSIRQIPLQRILAALQKVFDVETIAIGTDTAYKLKSSFADDIELALNKKSITIHSHKASNLILTFDNGKNTPLTSYFNYYNEFIINFEDLSLVYTNRKLFKDSKLISYIDNFIEAFNGRAELNSVTSEKGTFTTASTSFTINSIFNFVENRIIHDADYSILDDLGNEWADHIKLKGTTLTFIHSKYGDSQFSASSFHEVVGQALKNIGNMTPSTEQLDTKAVHWANTLNIGGTNTAITRLRRGTNLTDGIAVYKKLLLNPNLKREIILTVNFISRGQLRDRLNKLKAGTPFSEKNQVIQILWLLSSLINSCQENGIGVHIICKP
ncbi:hypothetical protein [Rhizosphaericola mali]|uniref:Uncharacterized protein n=1 Tax=Rhizosphaericola mali TaxID=2545455 RepID=A0A5P2FWS5_9BACT|nr:hypothetical protein [Rhizosphaericola mali]QES87357.1 hypothetical protein E0W69_001340 [Rhizosphaericola mali]